MPPPTDCEQAPINAPTSKRYGKKPGHREKLSVVKPDVVTMETVWKIVELIIEKTSVKELLTEWTITEIIIINRTTDKKNLNSES